MYLNNGQEVQFGDVITFTQKHADPIFGDVVTTYTTPITKENIRGLVQEGEINTFIDRQESTVDLKALYLEASKSLCEKYGYFSLEYFNKYVNKLLTIEPSIVFSMYMKELAIILDKPYPQHISKCEEVYVFSNVRGKISKMPTSIAKNFRNFAAFRTLDDAKIACATMRKLIKKMYND